MTTKPKRGRPKKAKQAFLDGMEPPSIKELDDAAEIYFDAMQERVKLSKEEDEAKDNLIDLMKQNDLSIYETADGKVVSVLNKSNVKVKKRKDTNGEDGSDDET